VSPGIHRVAAARLRLVVASMASRRLEQALAELARSCLAGPVCHEPQTHRRNKHICRFRHIFVVDPGFVVDPVHSRTPDQPQDPDQPQ
jgi:hypothetical protein